MTGSFCAKFFALSIIISTVFISGNSETSAINISSPDTIQVNHLHNTQILTYKEKLALATKIRRRSGFLLTGCIVHQSARALGYFGVGLSIGAIIVGGAFTGGPAGAGAAYLTALASAPTALATVESASLALGVAASWIPGLP